MFYLRFYFNNKPISLFHEPSEHKKLIQDISFRDYLSSRQYKRIKK